MQRDPADSIGKILQALPLQNGATQNTQVNNGGDGTTRVNLPGLGDERTLVLLNGRRFIFGGLGADAAVDLNMIPLAMIERVEVLPGGASAIYGADAVAGVVNIITRQSFAGIELGSGYDAATAGDGGIATLHAVSGGGDERGSLLVGAEYVDQSGVSQSRRGYPRYVETLETPQGPIIHGGSYITPQGLFIVPDGANLLGLPPDDNGYTTVGGTPGKAPGDFREFDATRDLFNYAPYNFLQTPQRAGVRRVGLARLGDELYRTLHRAPARMRGHRRIYLGERLSGRR